VERFFKKTTTFLRLWFFVVGSISNCKTLMRRLGKGFDGLGAEAHFDAINVLSLKINFESSFAGNIGMTPTVS
jgi:hypothetical protein